MVFRVAFVAIFLFSMIAIPVYALSILGFRPFFGWLVLVLIAVYLASGRYRAEFCLGEKFEGAFREENYASEFHICH